MISVSMLVMISWKLFADSPSPTKSIESSVSPFIEIPLSLDSGDIIHENIDSNPDMHLSPMLLSETSTINTEILSTPQTEIPITTAQQEVVDTPQAEQVPTPQAQTETKVFNRQAMIERIDDIPKKFTTAGMIFYTKRAGEVYIFLGKIRKGNTQGLSGHYSDMEHNVWLDGVTTITDNLLGFVMEQTAGRIGIGAQDLLDKCFMVYKNTSIGREIFYILYEVKGDELIELNKMAGRAGANAALIKDKAGDDESAAPDNAINADIQNTLKNDMLGMEDYKWLSLSSILSQNCDKKDIGVTDIDDTLTNITIRQHLCKDFFKNEELQNLLGQL